MEEMLCMISLTFISHCYCQGKIRMDLGEKGDNYTTGTLHLKVAIDVIMPVMRGNY